MTFRFLLEKYLIIKTKKLTSRRSTPKGGTMNSKIKETIRKISEPRLFLLDVCCLEESYCKGCLLFFALF